MLSIARKPFFASLHAWLGSLTQQQVDGLTALLDHIEPDAIGLGRMQEWAAYGLATAYHETAHTWQPVPEIGKGRGRPYGQPAGPYGHIYYGRGYVQTTWYRNYQRLAKVSGVDVVRDPELAMRPDVAYVALSRGMVEGWYGKKLSSYIWVNENGTVHADYIGARHTVNGSDRADLIAGYAHRIELALRAT